MPALVKDPVYCQLNALLRDSIARGKFAPGAQFLTERQISERFGVSRATANKALSNLVAEGVLAFRKGVGTFVRGGILAHDLRALVSFTEKARAAGRRPSTRVLRFTALDAARVPEDVHEALHLKSGQQAFYVERLRQADRHPVILERRYLAARFCPRLARRALAGSLYRLLTQHFKLQIEEADETIRAVALTGRDARLLRARPGAAALLVTCVAWLSGGEPLWHEQTLYRGDAYEFRNRLGPIQTARPAAGVLIRPAPARPKTKGARP
jgi:GntR family transcriptional regulator